jgi:uncharacterized protein YndB with AHSA1/START domain
MDTKQAITIKANVNAPVEKVWKLWNTPSDITQWNAASDDWHTTRAENELWVGGKLSARMEAKDGSFGFDFGGIYDEVIPNKKLTYTLGDGRKVDVTFEGNGQQTNVIETFDAESENSIEMQRNGWQAILDNFKKYAEKE